ncbi:hypothetical protein PR048_025310 [Dryococelus australis]|uniref:Uncharacterized protein n=1 Tax=Dryococelus australis TaxID=614101 RepID=A0ABQ9GR43_9NEOP|nr:hypothetical protein PR048_025310 [Dryococelus australis]
MEQRRNERAGRQKTPEKTIRPAASSSTMYMRKSWGRPHRKSNPVRLDGRRQRPVAFPGERCSLSCIDAGFWACTVLTMISPVLQHVRLSDKFTPDEVAHMDFGACFLAHLSLTQSFKACTCDPTAKMTERETKPGSGSLPDFHMWESCRKMLSVAGFLWDLPFPFLRPCIPVLLHTHLASPLSALKTSIRVIVTRGGGAVPNSSLHLLCAPITLSHLQWHFKIHLRCSKENLDASAISSAVVVLPLVAADVTHSTTEERLHTLAHIQGCPRSNKIWLKGKGTKSQKCSLYCEQSIAISLSRTAGALFSIRKARVQYGSRGYTGSDAMRRGIPSYSWRILLVHMVFVTSRRTLSQSSPSGVTADHQCTVDIGIFAHKTVESSLQATNGRRIITSSLHLMAAELDLILRRDFQTGVLEPRRGITEYLQSRGGTAACQSAPGVKCEPEVGTEAKCVSEMGPTRLQGKDACIAAERDRAVMAAFGAIVENGGLIINAEPRRAFIVSVAKIWNIPRTLSHAERVQDCQNQNILQKSAEIQPGAHELQKNHRGGTLFVGKQDTRALDYHSPVIQTSIVTRRPLSYHYSVLFVREKNSERVAVLTGNSRDWVPTAIRRSLRFYKCPVTTVVLVTRHAFVGGRLCRRGEIWAAFNDEVIDNRQGGGEVSMEQHRSEREGETGRSPRKPLLTSSIVRHDSHALHAKIRGDPGGIESGSPLWEVSRLTAQPPRSLVANIDTELAGCAQPGSVSQHLAAHLPTRLAKTAWIGFEKLHPQYPIRLKPRAASQRIKGTFTTFRLYGWSVKYAGRCRQDGGVREEYRASPSPRPDFPRLIIDEFRHRSEMSSPPDGSARSDKAGQLHAHTHAHTNTNTQRRCRTTTRARVLHTHRAQNIGGLLGHRSQELAPAPTVTILDYIISGRHIGFHFFLLYHSTLASTILDYSFISPHHSTSTSTNLFINISSCYIIPPQCPPSWITFLLVTIIPPRHPPYWIKFLLVTIMPHHALTFWSCDRQLEFHLSPMLDNHLVRHLVSGCHIVSHSMYLHTDIYLLLYQPTNPLLFLPSHLHTVLPTYLHSYLTTYCSTHLPATPPMDPLLYLPTCIPTALPN